MATPGPAPLDSAESVKGLTTLKGLVEKYSKAPVDGDETRNFDAFKTGDVGMMIDSWWVPGALDTGDLKGDVGAFALPGTAPARRPRSSSAAPTLPSRPGAPARDWPCSGSRS